MRERNLLEDPPDNDLEGAMGGEGSYARPVSMGHRSGASRVSGTGYEYGAAAARGEPGPEYIPGSDPFSSERVGGLTRPPPVAGSASVAPDGSAHWDLQDYFDQRHHNSAYDPYHPPAAADNTNGQHSKRDSAMTTTTDRTSFGSALTTSSSPQSPSSSPRNVIVGLRERRTSSSQPTVGSNRDSNGNSHLRTMSENPFGDVHFVDLSVSTSASGSGSGSGSASGSGNGIGFTGYGAGAGLGLGFGGREGRNQRCFTPPLSSYLSTPATTTSMTMTLGPGGVPVPSMTPLSPVRLHSRHSHTRSTESHHHAYPPSSFSNSIPNSSNNSGRERAGSTGSHSQHSHSRSGSRSGSMSMYSGPGSRRSGYSHSHSIHSRPHSSSAHGQGSPVVHMSDIDRDKLEDGDNIPLVALHLPHEDVHDVSQPRPDPLHHSSNEDEDDDEDTDDGDEDDVLGYPPMTTTNVPAPAVSDVALNSNLIVVEAHHGNQSNVSLSDAVDYSRRVI